MSARVHGWETAFVKAITVEREKSFAYGRADCATLMGASVRACHGKRHPALKILKRYSTRIGAARILAKEGSIGAVLAQFFEEVPKAMAQTGDLAIVINARGEEAGCVIDQARAIGRHPETGFFFAPVAAVKQVFRV